MKNHSFSPLTILTRLTGLGLAALATSSAAQDQRELVQLPELAAGAAQATSLPPAVRHFRFDAQTGSMQETGTQLGAEGAPPCFENIVLANGLSQLSFYTTPEIGEELVDWGTKSCGGSGYLQSFTFGYRTTADDPVIGGPGGSLSVALYSGTNGFGDLGSEIYRHDFLGLPGEGTTDPTIFSPLHGPVVFVTVDFGTRPLCLPDGPVGWGYMEMDGVTGPLLISAPNATLGTIDGLDVYTPGPATSGVYSGTFGFGAGNDFASTYMVLEEVPVGPAASYQVVAGTGVNPLIFDEELPGVLGETWLGRIDLSQNPQALFTVVCSSWGDIPPRLTPSGELLIDPSQRLAPCDISYGVHTMAIPKDLTLVGRTIYMQGAVRKQTRFQLTNALALQPGF